MRTIHRHVARSAAALAAGAVLFGLTGLAAAPAATAAEAAMAPTVETSSTAAITKQFTLTNESSRPLTIDRYAARDRVMNESGLPPVGTVLQPGQRVTFDVVFHFFYVNSLHVYLSAPGLPSAYSATMTVSDGIALPSSAATSSGQFAHGEDGTSLWVRDRVGTVIDVGAGDPKAQSRILQDWCAVKGSTCTFTPTGQEHFTAAMRKAASYTNPSTADQSYTAEFAHTRIERDDLEVSASVKLNVMDVVEAGVTATYGKSWERTDSRVLTYPVIVPAHTRLTVLTGAQMLRTTGDFTVKMGNTTWILHDVAFETPEMTNFGPDIELVPEKLPPAELAELAGPDTHVLVDGPGQVLPAQ